jgi:hypothetical protein
MDITASIISSVIGASSGALSAYLLNWWHWERQYNSERLLHRCARVLEQIDLFEKVSMQYWLAESFVEQSGKKALEIEIKSKSLMLAKMIAKLRSMCRGKLSPGESIQIKTLFDNLYDISTGDSFESSIKVSEPVIAYEINKICTKLKLQISEIHG